MRKRGFKTFINDDESYSFVRELVVAGRVITLQANLLGNIAFQSIAELCRHFKLKVGALYLSNAEQYWPYQNSFKENIKALDFTDEGFVMRTAATKPVNKDYRYSIQPAAIMKNWLVSPYGTSVRKITKAVYVRKPDQFPFSIDKKLPPTKYNND